MRLSGTVIGKRGKCGLIDGSFATLLILFALYPGCERQTGSSEDLDKEIAEKHGSLHMQGLEASRPNPTCLRVDVDPVGRRGEPPETDAELVPECPLVSKSAAVQLLHEVRRKGNPADLPRADLQAETANDLGYLAGVPVTPTEAQPFSGLAVPRKVPPVAFDRGPEGDIRIGSTVLLDCINVRLEILLPDAALKGMAVTAPGVAVICTAAGMSVGRL
jgi:hypothetical protein